MRTPARLVALTSAALLTTGGATLAVAPTASAVSMPSKCQYAWNTPHYAKTTAVVNLRTGPSTSYSSKGNLSKRTRFTHYCIAYPHGKNWAWGKVTSGPNKGKRGWVYYKYLTL
ncbi:hypothetical protein SMD44_p10071 (plasmid) [Streptomyces alboflavus]|uniref:SH3b domain-containing protein n=1 Tax=Streptomyces alboflavus TaxID=67267 RepID=A0A291W2Q2_9ACTN|nr:SH3 domain-containing protein [Streptomyces alboflavus]ATM24570.1 hypothetical protein SMD44_p10071 [Streptomyces alboflavus]